MYRTGNNGQHRSYSKSIEQKWEWKRAHNFPIYIQESRYCVNENAPHSFIFLVLFLFSSFFLFLLVAMYVDTIQYRRQYSTAQAETLCMQIGSGYVTWKQKHTRRKTKKNTPHNNSIQLNVQSQMSRLIFLFFVNFQNQYSCKRPLINLWIAWRCFSQCCN